MKNMFIRTINQKDNKAYLFQPIEITVKANSPQYGSGIKDEMKVAIFHSDGTYWCGNGYHHEGGEWRIRFTPTKSGHFSWSLESDDPGLNNQKGEFIVGRKKAENIFLTHGPIEISESGRFFQHQDGTPFFWLGESLWAVAQQATDIELNDYFEVRNRQGLSVVQFNTLLNWESTTPYRREPFIKESDQPNLDKYDPGYFQFLDKLFDKCASNDMLTAAVVLWFNYLPGEKPDWYDPPYKWPVFTENQAYRYGKFLGARYGAFPVVWIISADIGHVDTENLPILHAAVEGLYEASFNQPIITYHNAAKCAYHPILAQQDWHSFHFIQSGHRSDAVGFPSGFVRAARTQTNKKPVVNGEMFFEGLGHTREDKQVPLEMIRRAAWESFLSGANAGISYGAHGLWCWYSPELEFRMDYLWQKPMPWRNALNFEGFRIYQNIKEFFKELPWFDLEEATDIPIHELSEEPTTASRIGDGKYIIIYLPKMRKLRLTDPGLINAPAKWFDPIDGHYEETEIVAEHGGVGAQLPSWTHDGVLLIGPLR